MNNELVSIIIPTYKRSNMIENAIKSVLNQTYKNIEIIVIDDNANNPLEREKTSNIIKKYEGIKYIQNKNNLGGALTRNEGIINSNGKYIAFLDDDDIFYPTKIEKQMSLIKELEKKGKKIGMIYCDKTKYDKDNNHKKSPKINLKGNILLEHMLNKMETTSTWLCPKEVLLNVGMFENVKAHQDNILLMKILGNGYSIDKVKEYLVDFYIHNGDGITKLNKEYIEYTKTLFEYKKLYYDKLTKDEIEKVEYCNSSMLIRMYKNLNMKKEYCEEMKKVLKNNKFRIHTIKMLLFYIFIKDKGGIKNERTNKE